CPATSKLPWNGRSSSAIAQMTPVMSDPTPPPPLPVGSGLVQTTVDDPLWVLATSDAILRANDCVAECAAQPDNWYDRLDTPCRGIRFWKFDSESLCGHAELTPMEPFSAGTFDSLYVRENCSFQLFTGDTLDEPFGPRMQGPQYVSIDWWRD